MASSSIDRSTAGRSAADALPLSKNRASITPVLLLSLVLLVAAHLIVREFFPNPAFWLIGAVVVLAISVAWIMARKDYFEFLLVLFICAHFAFADTQGGLWSYIFCATLLVGSLIRSPRIKMSAVPGHIRILSIVFLAMQVLGIILNPYPPLSNVQGTVIVFSYVMVFYLCASQTMTESRSRQLLSIWLIMACYSFLVGLNQRYQLILTPSPLLPYLVYKEGSLNQLVTVPSGPFQNAELYGEYFCLVFSLSMVMLISSKELVSQGVRKAFFLVMVVISAAAIVMGAARSAAILAVVVLLFLLFINPFLAPSGRSLKQILSLALAACLVVGIIAGLRSYLFVGEMAKKMALLNPSTASVGTILSGKSIHRGELIEAGTRRLAQRSWWVGFGYSVPENNAKSLGLRKGTILDFHNLYLSAPMYFGWLGAAAYFLMVIATGLRAYVYHVRHRKRASILVPFALACAIIWGVFLLDQYKIDASRNPSYWLMTWMLLGWTHAVINSLPRRQTETVRRLRGKQNYRVAQPA